MLIELERLFTTPMMAVFRRPRLISCSQAKSLRHPAFRIVAPTSRAFSTCFGSFVMARISAFAGPVGSRRPWFPITQRRQINLYKGRKFFLRQPRSRAQHFNRLRVDLGCSGRLTSPSNDLIVLSHAFFQISKQFLVHCASYQFSLCFFRTFFSAALQSSLMPFF